MNKKIINDNKYKLSHGIGTFLGIIFIGALLFTAIIFPKYYCKVYDKNTLNKISYTNAKINTYETLYKSFPEKISALALAFENSEGYKLRAIRINEPQINISKQELTEIANNELADIRNNDIILKKFKLNKKKLTVNERYTIYQANENDNFQSISLLKLVYENPKKTITLYLDEEFHKIYSLDIMHNKSFNAVSADISYDTSINIKSADNKTAASAYSDEVSDKSIPSIYDLENPYTTPDKYNVFNGIIGYYNLNSSNNNITFDYWYETDQFHITFMFENNYRIDFYERFFFDEYEKLHYTIGIPLEEMIQF